MRKVAVTLAAASMAMSVRAISADEERSLDLMRVATTRQPEPKRHTNSREIARRLKQEARKLAKGEEA